MNFLDVLMPKTDSSQEYFFKTKIKNKIEEYELYPRNNFRDVLKSKSFVYEALVRGLMDSCQPAQYFSRGQVLPWQWAELSALLPGARAKFFSLPERSEM